MKKLFITLSAVLVSVSTFGQGTILFNTRVTPQVDAPVSRGDGTGAGLALMRNCSWSAAPLLLL